MDAGVLLLHGLFEHKGRHQINSDWFENLNISPHSIDLPGHGEETTIKGHIDSWEENNEALINGFRNLSNHIKKIDREADAAFSAMASKLYLAL